VTSTWVVIPTYDEAGNLEALVAEVRAALRRVPGSSGRVLIVDDGSPDGTGHLADALALAHPDVETLHRPGKAGLGGAYLEGFARALAGGADLVCQMDADFSHDPHDLPRLVARVRAGADVVIGSRYVAGGSAPDWTPGRRLLSRAGGAYARRMLGLDVVDPTGGFRCCTAQALDALDLGAVAARGFAFQIEMTYRAALAGLNVAEVPIAFGERRAGRSKMSAAIALEALWRVPALRRRVAGAPRSVARPGRLDRQTGAGANRAVRSPSAVRTASGS
jgi:dolichol-phosphate mannosyltransferase